MDMASRSENGIAVPKTKKIDGFSFLWGDVEPNAQYAFNKTLDQARKQRKKLRQKLVGCSELPNSILWARQHDYVSSQRVRLSALVEAAKRAPFHKRPTIKQCLDWSKSAQFHLPIDETVILKMLAKASGGHRFYCAFGTKHKAAQRLAADMLRYTFKPKPWQYDAKSSGGVRAAVKATKKHIDNGYLFVKRLDIKKFFDNFDHAGIKNSDVKLRPKLIEHVVLGTHYKMKVDPKLSNSPLGGDAADHVGFVTQTGIPQGSAVSPLVANFFTSGMKVKMPSGAKVINYVDDFLVLAKSDEALQKAENALKSAVSGLSVGEFELLEKSGSSPHHSEANLSKFEFLGHAFVYNGIEPCRAFVNSANMQKFDHEVVNRLELASKPFDPPLPAKAMAEARREAVLKTLYYIRCWKHTFSEADNLEDANTSALACIEAFLSDCPVGDLNILQKQAQKLKPSDLLIY